MLLPVILSGGAGTRLWPLSRELYPKQLLPLVGEQTMLQETLIRLHGLQDLAAPLVVCNEVHRFMVAEQLREGGVQAGGIILEPCGRNTAPAVALAALHALAGGDDPLLLVLPADHVIRDSEAFKQTVLSAVDLAESGRLVTFGIVPEAPETGYGYIRAGEPLGFEVSGQWKEGGRAAQLFEETTLPSKDSAAFSVDSFVEKPDRETAQTYLDSGDYYWNSGMFLFRASVYLQEIERFNPDMAASCRTAQRSLQADLDFLRIDGEIFAACPSDSIDYAVMEKTDRAAVVPLTAGWSDVGSWTALWDIGTRDEAGNLINGDVIAIDSRNSYLKSNSRLLATVGVDNLVVVETADAVLVAARDQVQQVKEVVGQLKQQQRSEAELHCRVNRPWGAYQGIDAGERFQVKRISVNPGASLSLQKHHHRAEHWIVARGTARVTCGDEVRIVRENQSTYIPLGETHRLENPGKIPLEIIEVQSGPYLGEDDIVRFEDHYGRE